MNQPTLEAVEIMAELRADSLPSPLLRLGNRNDFRMELEEFLAIWNCSDEEIEQISNGRDIEDLRNFDSTPTEASYRLGLYHQLWSRQLAGSVESGAIVGQFKVSVPQPQTPGLELWAELDELYAFDMTPREFQVFWQVEDWQLAKILRQDIKQVQTYLKLPPNRTIPPLVCFLLGFVHHHWLSKLSNERISLAHPSARCCRAVQNQYNIPSGVTS